MHRSSGSPFARRHRFRKGCRIAVSLLAALLPLPAAFAAPDDIVSRTSGFYDAAAVLAMKHVLPPGSPDAADFLSPSAPLRTRAQFAALIAGIDEDPMDARANAALAFLRKGLQEDVLAPVPDAYPVSAGPAVTGSVTGEAGVRDNGSRKSEFDLFGEGRVLGVTGRIGYTASVRNDGLLWRDHDAFTPALPGQDHGGRPDALNGVQDASVTYYSRHGAEFTAGLLDPRWGPGYRGGLLVSDSAPARPTLQVAFPFSLGHGLGSFRYVQYQQVYSNAGHTVTMGARRVEHPIGDRVDLSLQEAFIANRLRGPGFLVLPYYAYQKIFIHNNAAEPNEFNYNVDASLTYRPLAGDPDQRIYVDFMIDDIQAPKGLGLGNHVPRKVAYLVGAAGKIRSSGTDGVIEYMHADPRAFTKAQAGIEPLGWFYDGLPLAHPAGSNASEIYGRLGQAISSRWSMAVDARRRVRIDDSFPAPSVRELGAAVTYHLTPAASVGVRYSDFREDPFPGTGDTAVVAGGEDFGSRIREKLAAVDVQVAF
jgi:hypothetical protein